MAAVGEQLTLSRRENGEETSVRRDTELHNTDFKGERMSVKKDAKIHVEKDTKIHEHTCQVSIIVKCKFQTFNVTIIFLNVISALT